MKEKRHTTVRDDEVIPLRSPLPTYGYEQDIRDIFKCPDCGAWYAVDEDCDCPPGDEPKEL